MKNASPPPLKRSELRKGMIVQVHPGYHSRNWTAKSKRLIVCDIRIDFVILRDETGSSFEGICIDENGYGVVSKKPVLMAVGSASGQDGNLCPDCGAKGEFVNLAMKCPKCWKVW